MGYGGLELKLPIIRIIKKSVEYFLDSSFCPEMKKKI